MKAILAPILVLCMAACLTAKAANLSITKSGANVHSVFLNGGPSVFDTIGFRARPNPPSVFSNYNSGLQSGVPRPAGQAFTYINRVLNGDPLDDPSYLGLTTVGLVNTPAEFSFYVGKLGHVINTNGNLFLANLYMPSLYPEGAVGISLFLRGQLVQELGLSFPLILPPPPPVPPLGPPPPPLPEPAALTLGGLAFMGLVGAARRRTAARNRNI